MGINNRGKKVPWTKEEYDILNANYNGYGMAVKCSRILREHGFTRTSYACQAKAKILKINSPRDPYKYYPDWTAREDEYITNNHDRLNAYEMALKLKRTPLATAQRRKFLGLDGFAKDGWYGLQEVAWMFGVNQETVRRLIDRGELKASRHNGVERPKAPWHIQESDVYDFLMTYPSYLNGRNCDMVQILAIASKHSFKYRGN